MFQDSNYENRENLAKIKVQKIDPAKLHTTALGEVRVKKNTGLTINEVIAWHKQGNFKKVEQKGKNWYVYSDDFVLTINVKSHTIITAHKRKK